MLVEEAKTIVYEEENRDQEKEKYLQWHASHYSS